MTNKDEYPELKKLGYTLVGLAILAAVVFVRMQCVSASRAPAATAPVPQDMATALPSAEEFDAAMAHMKAVIDKAAAEENRREKRTRRKKNSAPNIPGLEYLGTTDRSRRFRPAD